MNSGQIGSKFKASLNLHTNSHTNNFKVANASTA